MLKILSPNGVYRRGPMVATDELPK